MSRDGVVEFLDCPVTIKPWGSELLIADGAGGYVAKIITVNPGQSLSLQYHERKDETMHVLAGKAVLTHGRDTSNLEQTLLETGATVRIPAGTIHRIHTQGGVTLMEASTALDGWREDVTRLEDSYGREGTSRP